MTERVEISPHDRAYEGIIAFIDAHGLQPGEALPAERELCELLGVSRTTLRSAITQLISENVIESRHGSGNYVAPRRPVATLQTTRGFTDVVTAAGRKPGTRLVVQEVVVAGGALADRMEVAVGTPTLHLRRVRTIDGIPAHLDDTYVNLELAPGLEEADFSQGSLYEALERGYGIVSAHGSARFTVARLTGEEAQLLEVGAGDPAYCERGLVMDEGRRPIELYTSLMLPSLYGIESDSTTD